MWWQARGGKLVAQKGNWGSWCLRGGVSGRTGLGALGVSPRNLQPCVAAPRGAPPEIQPEPPVCLFMPLVPRSPTLHHQLNFLTLILRIGRVSSGNTWEEKWKHAYW